MRANPFNCLAFSLGKTPIQTIPSTATPAKKAIIHKVFAIRTDCWSMGWLPHSEGSWYAAFIHWGLQDKCFIRTILSIDGCQKSGRQEIRPDHIRTPLGMHPDTKPFSLLTPSFLHLAFCSKGESANNNRRGGPTGGLIFPVIPSFPRSLPWHISFLLSKSTTRIEAQKTKIDSLWPFVSLLAVCQFLRFNLTPEDAADSLPDDQWQCRSPDLKVTRLLRHTKNLQTSSYSSPVTIMEQTTNFVSD